MEESIQNLIENFRTFTGKTMAEISNQTEFIEKVLSCPTPKFLSMPMEKLEQAMLSLSQYALFLNNEYNTAKTEGRLRKVQFEDRLAQVLVANKIEARSKDERTLMARKTDKELDGLFMKMEEHELKLRRLEGLPMSINMHVAVMRDIYHRRGGGRKNGYSNS